MDLENRKVDEWEIETQRIKCPRGQILQGQGPCWARNIGMSSLAIQVVKILHFSCKGHGFCPWPMNYYSTSLVAQPKIKKPLKTNRKKKKDRNTGSKESLCSWEGDSDCFQAHCSPHNLWLSVSEHNELWVCRALSGKEGASGKHSWGPHLPPFSGHKSRWFWEWKTKLQAPDKWIVRV